MSDGGTRRERRRREPPKPAGPVGLRRNNTSYPTQASAKLRELHAEYQRAVEEGDRDARVLKYYQYLVREVMTRPEYGIGESGNGRGLLIYHTMGMGKTLLAVACALAMRDVRTPLVIAPKSLHKNFEVNIDKLTSMLGGSAADAATNRAFFKYVSLDAHNMAKQVARATTGVEGAGSLTGRLLIIDEAHTFFRAVINSPHDQTNARQLYHMVMAAKDLRILFLTGTPSSKDPFELVPCFNMLVGEELLPPQYDAFREAYVDKLRLKNRGKLANRLLGLVSHVTPIRPTGPQSDATSLPEPRSDGWYPEVLEPQVLRVEMGEDQYRAYLAAREREEGERGGPGGDYRPGARLPRGPPKLSLPGASEGAGGTYYHHSRVLSNFAPAPEHGEALDAARLPDAAFDARSSPKAALLVKELSKGPAPSLVYSQYVGVGGLAVIARFLDLAGWERFDPSGPSGPSGPAGAEEARRPQDLAEKEGRGAEEEGAAKEGLSAGKPFRYAVITGDVSPEDRAVVMRVATSPENRRGELIRAVLGSSVVALGYDFKNIRRVYKFEPYWDKALEDQVDARGVRMGSHDALPPEERDVQSFLLLATANQKVKDGMAGADPDAEVDAPQVNFAEDETINERFHRRALDQAALNGDMRKLLREVSIECGTNDYGECRMCVPTDMPLFGRDPTKDLKLADPCMPLEESEVEAKEIELGGEKFFYAPSPASVFGVEFFAYDAVLEAHTPVDPASERFQDLLAAWRALEP